MGTEYVRLCSNTISDINTIKLFGVIMKKKIKSKADKFIHYFGEGTLWDLDYGKLLILFICIYIAIQVSGCAVAGGLAWH